MAKPVINKKEKENSIACIELNLSLLNILTVCQTKEAIVKIIGTTKARAKMFLSRAKKKLKYPSKMISLVPPSVVPEL